MTLDRHYDVVANSLNGHRRAFIEHIGISPYATTDRDGHAVVRPTLTVNGQPVPTDSRSDMQHGHLDALAFWIATE